MTPNDSHLIELYWGLRQAGLPLRIEDYQLLYQAWEKGFQPENFQQLRQLCERLWVKSLAEKQCFHNYFDQYQKEWSSQPKSLPHPIKSPETETQEQSTQNSTQTQPLLTKQNQSENLTPEATEQLQVGTAASLNTTGNKSTLSSLFTLSDEYFPLTRRQMKQGWRKLRQPVREGAAVELDIPSTIKRISQQGFLLELSLIPSRVNRTQLLLLIDQSNSMVPFSPISERLIETAMQEGRLGETKIYYFCNVPENFLYTDIDLLEEEALTDIIPHLHKNHTIVMIFSDSGAARGGFNSARVELTKQFLNRIKPLVRQVTWLNPLPTNRWHGNTASWVAKLLPMYSFNQAAWRRMIDVLQGKKVALGESEYLTDEFSLETNKNLAADIKAKLEQLKPASANSESYESAINYIVHFAKLGQAYLDLACHAAFPLALTPDLLYYLRENFLYDEKSKSLNILWLAVPDLLLSTLCQSAGLPLYEMDSTIRHLLLKLLQKDERFGNQRLEQLSQCLLFYLQQRLENTNLDIKDFGEKPQWIELAYTKPSQLARELALILRQTFSGDKAEKVRTASLTATFVEPLAEVGYQPLLTFASGWGRFARGYEQKAKEIFDTLPTNSSELDIEGVKLKIPTRSELSQFSFDVATVNVQRKIVINRSQQTAQYFIEDLGNKVELNMVLIKSGNFIMGAPKTEEGSSDSERPQHQVTVPSFFMGKYPITQAQWKAVASLPQVNRSLEPDPSNFKGDNRPVECVSWFDAVEYCDRLSQHTGKIYRLPSEAEWEYACRAGTTTPFHFGETITTDLANYRGTDDKENKWSGSYGRGTKGIYRQETTDVGSFGVANAFGLYDMHGNAWEWCADHWHSNYEGAPTDGSAWLSDNSDNDNNYRLLRGGSWHYGPEVCRSGSRNDGNPDFVNYIIGFRVVCGVLARILSP